MHASCAPCSFSVGTYLHAQAAVNAHAMYLINHGYFDNREKTEITPIEAQRRYGAEILNLWSKSVEISHKTGDSH